MLVGHTSHIEIRLCNPTDRRQLLGAVVVAFGVVTRDPRFRPLERAELEGTHIEISVLSPLRRARPEELIIGRHGVVIERGLRRGLLLPQVAITQKWDRQRFLEEACIKAGLDPEAWKHPETSVELFSAEIFEEKDN